MFKWKQDSALQLHHNLDPVGNDVNNLIEQGKSQLEVDEEVFAVLDHSLPGRRRIVIRDAFFDGLPPDLMERRRHGVREDVPEQNEDEDMNLASGTQKGKVVCPTAESVADARACRSSHNLLSGNNEYLADGACHAQQTSAAHSDRKLPDYRFQGHEQGYQQKQTPKNQISSTKMPVKFRPNTACGCETSHGSTRQR